MFSICLRYCKNENDAADILQEAFIKVFRKIEDIKDEAHIAGWIKTIVVRTALRHIENKKEYLALDEGPVINQSYQMTVDFDTYSYDRMLAHLRSLPVGYKTVFNLYVFEEMSHTEIARELNCSVNTSRSQLYKARQLMQRLINEDARLKDIMVLRNEHE